MGIKVHHVGPKIARPSNSQNGVHVSAIKINEATLIVDQIGDLLHLIIK